MAYRVLALKWRPSTFEEVVGQEVVSQTLRNAIRSDRLAHAFLFAGMRGVGKTTMARILAKCLNCNQNGPTETPCSECDACREIAAGNNIDVLEIDAASNTGVDNIRDLRESVRYGTARDRFKIFIIDEVHMLSNAAFNALLKTLEEPPPHVKFILATTEHHKIPVTITSRCQQFDFRPIPFRLILARLQKITRQENVEISEEALQALASAAEGSLRDAQSMLDQAISFGGESVSDEAVYSLLGVVDGRVVRGLIEAVGESRHDRILEHLQETQDHSIDPLNLCKKLALYVRHLLVCRTVGWDDRLLPLPDSGKDWFVNWAQRFSELDLIRFYDLLNQTQTELRWSVNPYLHLEIALVKWLQVARLPEVEQVVNQLLSGGSAESEKGEEPASSSLFEPPESEPVGSSPAGAVEVVPAAEEKQPASRSAPEPNQTKSVGSALLTAVQRESLPLYSSLQHAEISFADGVLVLRFAQQDAIHAKLVQEYATRLEQLGSEITQSGVQMRMEVSEPETSAAAANPMEDPKVKAFLEEFPGKVIVDKSADG